MLQKFLKENLLSVVRVRSGEQEVIDKLHLYGGVFFVGHLFFVLDDILTVMLVKDKLPVIILKEVSK